jgi:hypothetical protein
MRTIIESLVAQGNLHKRLKPEQNWILTSLAWFLRKYLPFEPLFYVQSRGAILGAEQLAWYVGLLQQPIQNIMAENAAGYADLLRLLLFSIKAAGFQSVYLLVDGLEKWSGISEERTRQMLDAIFSTLVVLDSAELIFKFFAPESFKSRLESSAGVVKYWVNPINLTWDAKRLTMMLTQRVGLALGREISTAEFCPDDDFWNWLSKYGAKNPRAWLELAQPFVERFLQNSAESLSSAIWRDLALSHPPLLRTSKQKVWLAEYELNDITATEFDLLAYLEKNQDRICSLEEIYYQGLEKMEQIPAKNDPRWINKDDYRGIVDTALYRLRQKIEVDPGQPIYLVTWHSKGVQFSPRGTHAT